jgi:cobalt-zinc-cadmium efflux system membrane fusion protein
MKHLLPLCCLALILSCSGRNNDTSENAANDVIVSGDTLAVNPQSSMVSRIATAPVTKEFYEPTITTTGVVKAIPSAYAEVASPFAGRVQRCLVRIGQRVAAGTPLFEIH